MSCVKREAYLVKRWYARSTCRLLFAIGWMTGVLASHAVAEPLITVPQEVRVFDTPNDGGESLTVQWAPLPTDGPDVRFQVLVGDASTTDPQKLTVVAEFPSNAKYVKDVKTAWWTRTAEKTWHQAMVKSTKGLEVKNDQPYAVAVAAMQADQRLFSAVQVATPTANWFNWNQLNNLIIGLSFGGLVFFAITYAKRHEIFLRRIPGLDAVDEAIGRATELGKPILYLTGAHDLHDPSTIAAAVILGKVAKRAALYETELMVPHREPITMAVCQEITKQAYLEAGKPDLFKEDANFFITSDQFSYTAAVDGIMLRKKPAANFFMGHYFAESLLLTETGASTGAIQIAGTDADHQLPFFVTTCDYTLIGEELYAASAYLSKESVQIGTLRGQDIGKAVILAALAVGTVLATVGVVTGAQWPQFFLDLMRDLK
ncbi:conserved membrane hypothetical protein [Candidatus Nitrospira nitrosa]|uniref:DUF6754 domain-containing protein n=1 Tax=Candidatus Nitrospira nitrosa TaxID=1742972 RepID=A0A0S4LI31_9BACT|nr:conserved membrane hypothetical protein [Candidatus Nitrospira nitrosa]